MQNNYKHRHKENNTVIKMYQAVKKYHQQKSDTKKETSFRKTE
jgi:hypothetical protein